MKRKLILFLSKKQIMSWPFILKNGILQPIMESFVWMKKKIGEGYCKDKCPTRNKKQGRMGKTIDEAACALGQNGQINIEIW